MSYPADRIIQINARIRAAGLSNANFASAYLFVTETPLPVGFSVDTARTYFDLADIGTDFGASSETYKAAERWLGGIPRINEITLWAVNPTDATITDTLNKARNINWWYWSFFTEDVLSTPADVLLIAQWCESNGSMFVNNQTGTSATAIRNQNTTDDIASQLTTLGIRHAFTPVHATDAYAGNALVKYFAKVNYSADKSTITGEFKKSPGVAAENLTSSQITAMESDTKKAVFYTVVDLQGSNDNGRWLNTFTHSTFGEYIDDVVNLDAFINFLTVALYNALANQTTKLAQTPVGQAVLIGTARNVCEQFVRNNYLGPRNYIDPDDAVEKFTAGYEILTVPEDILDLSDSDRDARKSAPIRIRIFRAGAIHQAIVDIDVF